MRRDVFQAIADPTRRAIIQMIATQSLNLNAVAEKFHISRPAISKHIRILTECGLIVVRQEGRERFCHPQLGQLAEVSAWADQYRVFWSAKLDSLGDFLETSHSSPTRKKAKTAKKRVNKKSKRRP